MRHQTVGLLVAVALLTGLGWSSESWAQTKKPRIGVLTSLFKDAATSQRYREVFRSTLAQRGWTQGENVSIEERSASGTPPQFSEAAAELVGLKVDVIFAVSALATRTAYGATPTIPIVGMDFTNDPVAAGYAESYARPGRNLTGVFLDAPEFAGKWLELLKAVVPRLSRAAVLWDPAPGRTHLKAIQDAARSLGVQVQVLEVHSPDDLGKAFASLHPRPQALIILPSPMNYRESARLSELALKQRLPGTSMASEFAGAGGLLSYGPDLENAWERCAVLVGKILAGASPGDLPIERPTKIQLVVNLKTAKALGLTVPESVLLRADKVIR